MLAKAFCISIFKHNLLPIGLLKSLTSSCASSVQSLILLPFIKASWLCDISSPMTTCNLLAKILEINLQITLQQDIDLKSARLDELSDLGTRVRKVWLISCSIVQDLEKKMNYSFCYLCTYYLPFILIECSWEPIRPRGFI